MSDVSLCFTQSFENRRILLLYMSEQKISDFMVHFGGRGYKTGSGNDCHMV